MNDPAHTTLDEILEVADFLRPSWPSLSALARSEGPVNDGDGGDGGGGGSGDEGGDGGGGDGGSGDGGENGGGDGGQGGSGDGDGGDGGSGDGGSGDGDGEVKLTKAEHDNLQRQAREARKLADEKKARERKEAEDKGEHEKLAQQEKDRADKAEADLRDERRENRGHRIAGRLKFKDTGDAVTLLKAKNAEALDDDSATEKALKAILKEKPHYAEDGGRQRQGNVGGDGGGKDDDEKVSGPGRMARAYGSSGD